MDQRRENPMARGRVSMEGVGCIQTEAPQWLTMLLYQYVALHSRGGDTLPSSTARAASGE